MESTPDDRRQAVVSAIATARRADERVEFVADDTGDRMVFEDRRLRVEVADRDRLEALLEEYGVFKVRQPATRKADAGVVYLSAVTDPKHAADFVESLFREVYEAPTDYRLRVEPG